MFALRTPWILHNVCDMEHPGATITAARVALRMTLTELAARAEVSEGYLSDVEAGKRVPSPRWMRDVNGALAAAISEKGAVA